MLIAIITMALSIVLFLCLYLGFCTGLRLGMNAAKGIIPEPVKTPINVVHEYKEHTTQERENKKIKEGIDAIMNYTGDVPEGD